MESFGIIAIRGGAAQQFLYRVMGKIVRNLRARVERQDYRTAGT
jgi:hypothetical protein